MQDAGRNRQEVGEGPVGIDDALYPACRAMARETRPAPVAGSTAEVDLADDPRPDERGVRCRRDLSDPLVSGRPLESEIAAADLEVGAADAGQAHADNGVLRTGPGFGQIGGESQPGTVPPKRSHAAAEATPVAPGGNGGDAGLAQPA